MYTQEHMENAIYNARQDERQRIIKLIRYYGITLRWSLGEIVTKLKEGDTGGEG